MTDFCFFLKIYIYIYIYTFLYIGSKLCRLYPLQISKTLIRCFGFRNKELEIMRNLKDQFFYGFTNSYSYNNFPHVNMFSVIPNLNNLQPFMWFQDILILHSILYYTTLYIMFAHDWVGKVIHWEMCKKFKFDHTNKCYVHNPAPVLENDTHKLQWDFNMHTDHLISTRRPLLITKKKENLQNCRLCCPNRPQNKTERRIITSTLLENWKSCGT